VFDICELVDLTFLLDVHPLLQFRIWTFEAHGLAVLFQSIIRDDTLD
jgi:hypothetical protein